MSKKTYIPTDANYFRYEGRILYRDGAAYLGHTNSSVSVRTDAGTVTFYIFTGDNEPVNDPSLRIYINGCYLGDHILSGPGYATYHYEHRTGGEESISHIRSQVILTDKWSDAEDGFFRGIADGSRPYELIIDGFDAGKIYDVKILKHTEAAMSHIGVAGVKTDGGELMTLAGGGRDREEDACRTKVEFIGDSITCGYGIHSPLSEDNYTLWDEDGEDNYAAIIAKKMNWDARWISASGYGMYMNYEGVREENVPKLYPCVNWFVDPQIRIDPGEFEPEFIFINLGTNDSNHIAEGDNVSRFKESYTDFLELLKKYHPKAKIICMIGTVCDNMYPYIKEAADKVTAKGYKDIYTFELTFFTPQSDGVADGHPTLTTHRKDAESVLRFMRESGLIG